MIRKKLEVKNKQGLHASPCGMISNTAMRFASDIKLVKDGYEVNAKSILGLLTLEAKKGSYIEVIANGPDEKDAIIAIEKIFETGFDEEL